MADLTPTDRFALRHVGPDAVEIDKMVSALDAPSLEALIDQAVPRAIRSAKSLAIGEATSEHDLLEELAAIAAKNQVFRSFIGLGYSDCITPPVILRNVLQNPGWYTAYTPYQAEIAQGRLEALLNFQTMIADLTGLPIANASLLDEGTAAAEAMTMMRAVSGGGDKAFFVSETCHPQTIEVVRTRAAPLGIRILVGDHAAFDFTTPIFGALLQYPQSTGAVVDYAPFCERAHGKAALVAVAADLLSLALLRPPGEFGADVAVGSAQRFGVPLGYGGPHAAFFATKSEYARQMPGRIIGISEDANGKPALRMALQTREQHIRREKATSNICTAQVLLAVMAGFYAAYHGPHGLRAIAERVHALTATLARGLKKLGANVRHDNFFDTLLIEGSAKDVKAWHANASSRRMNFRHVSENALAISLDETVSAADVDAILAIFANGRAVENAAQIARDVSVKFAAPHARTSGYLTHPVFNTHHSETEMQRYLRLLESRDLSLTHSMIPLGSCTMKLNAAAEMTPVTWTEFSRLHPFAPAEQAAGYATIFRELETMLAEITGFAAVSLQPNAGSQGEYAGLLAIRGFHQQRGQGHRDVCLIPASAHGTNPASAVMAGYKVVVVACDTAGNIDVKDLVAKADAHKEKLAALMVTYPSTHGVFEEEIREICTIVHTRGGQVYMDGANLNAQVGLCRPGDFGADVCHINLHKTFCIPHGGGGPGMGPIAVAPHLGPFLPRHPLAHDAKQSAGAVSSAPWGSASILLISWMYMRLMGGEGLAHATKVAILNANYVAHRLNPHYPVLYRGRRGRVAHECIIDLRPLKKESGIEVEDVAKRLMDYGFHAPTVSFPVSGTMMIEPTESEPKAELDRFCEAMIAIRREIDEVASGQVDRENNVLKHAPHTAETVIADSWSRPYSREKAAFPAPWTRRAKFWPSVGRLNNVLGDRKLFCTCLPIEAYAAALPSAFPPSLSPPPPAGEG